MLKILRYTGLVVFSFLWMVGCSSDLAKFLFEKKLIADDYRYGDLYRFSNLPQFRVAPEKCTSSTHSEIKNLAFYIMGDSFTEDERLKKNDFVAEEYHRYFISQPKQIHLDKTKKNVLLIETVERHVRERFEMPYCFLQVVDKEGDAKITPSFSAFDYELPYKDERLESALFGYDFFMKIKEWKAQINYKILGRVDDNVALSKDGKYLLYSLDTKPGIHSCFDSVSDAEVEKIAKNMEKTVENYKKLGFDEVIISVIPNKTSIVAPNLGTYNHIIERVQTKLKATATNYVDVYTSFASSRQELYDVGDSHWNCVGKDIWLKKVNTFLEQIPNKNKTPL